MLLLRSFFWCWKSLLKLGGSNFKRKTFSCYWKPFSLVFLSEEAVSRIVETYFSTNASFRVMEMDFLASANHFSYFFPRLLLRKAFFLSHGNVFLNESFIPAIGKGFFSPMETVTLLETFFLLVETVMIGNQFLKIELILTGRNWFSGWRKSFSSIVFSPKE